MSYQVLARKYRPRSFATLVGQDHVVRALSHALDSKRLHHAYLFTGTRGVGKTTLSRILAKAFNCQGTDGNGDVTSQPCGVCDACTAIDAGRFVDYIELDAASNRGVDEMAQLLEQAVYAPSNARFKVYMIDEVHMLTNHAFNAMLKTLEEPPEHVKFILATTDPQKIPVTVLSRCLQFNLKQMPPATIVTHLQTILAEENIEAEVPALRLLAQGAHGSMRDALSLTDQAIAYAAGTVTLDAVQGMLGALDQSYLLRLMEGLAARDGAALLAVADEMASRSLSYGGALRDLGTLLHQIALAQSVPAALPKDLPEHAAILRLATLFDADEVQLFYQIVVHGRNELGLAPDEYAGFSMTLLRMLAFRPVDAGNEPAPSTPKKILTAAASPISAPVVASAPAPVLPPAPVARLQAAPNAVAQSSVPPRPVNPGRAALDAARGIVRPSSGASMKAVSGTVPTVLRGASASAAVVTSAAMTLATFHTAAAAAEAARHDEFEQSGMPPLGEFSSDSEAAPATSVKKPSAVTAATAPKISTATTSEATVAAPLVVPVPVAIAALGWDGDWPSLAAQLPLRGVIQQLALQAELERCDTADGIEMRLRAPLETLATPANGEKLAAALTQYFSQPVRVQIEIGNVTYTANVKAEAARAQRQTEAELQIRSDPFVIGMLREFGATIVPGSIKPND